MRSRITSSGVGVDAVASPTSGHFPSYLTAKQAATYLSISVATLRRYVRSGQLPAGRIRREFRFRREDLDAALRSTVPSDGADTSLDDHIIHQTRST